jgi:hypothetical protein
VQQVNRVAMPLTRRLTSRPTSRLASETCNKHDYVFAPCTTSANEKFAMRRGSWRTRTQNRDPQNREQEWTFQGPGPDRGHFPVGNPAVANRPLVRASFIRLNTATAMPRTSTSMATNDGLASAPIHASMRSVYRWRCQRWIDRKESPDDRFSAFLRARVCVIRAGHGWVSSQ